jgi:hypothetical protein
MPTQKDEYVGFDVHVPAGCTHDADALVNGPDVDA